MSFQRLKIKDFFFFRMVAKSEKIFSINPLPPETFFPSIFFEMQP